MTAFGNDNNSGNSGNSGGNDAISRAIELLARLPGLGPRSAQRIVLHLLRHRETRLQPLAAALRQLNEAVRTCGLCGNLDVRDPCHICTDAKRAGDVICVVKDVADLWALERAAVFSGRYHVLGGLLSAIDGIGPQELRIPDLVRRVAETQAREVILALDATVEGQTTAHYIADALKDTGVKVSRLAHGVPVGSELEYLDEGTLAAALKERR